jgi:hypothetical protein
MNEHTTFAVYTDVDSRDLTGGRLLHYCGSWDEAVAVAKRNPSPSGTVTVASAYHEREDRVIDHWVNRRNR